MRTTGSVNNVLIYKLILLLVLVLCIPNLSYSGILFRDDFENQSSTWNIGLGPLSTPSGYEGQWKRWEYSNTCSGMGGNKGGTENCSDLPSWSGNKLTFIRPTSGYGGGKAIGTSLKTGCNNGYPGTSDYWFSKKYKEVYVGFHIKFENGFYKTFSAGCKVPLRIIFDTPSTSPHLFIQYPYGSFSSTNLYAYEAAGPFNNNKKFNTGISPSEIYNDHDWHWLEFRIKLNATADTSDGEFESWVDGVWQSRITGQKFYTSAHSQNAYLQRIWLTIGNCSTLPDVVSPPSPNNTPWTQQVWKSVLFDNFTVSTTYIGPPNSSSASSTSSTAPPPPGKPWVIQ